MTVKENLIEVVESLGYPVFQQGSLGDDEAYPESFFTFWNNSSPDTAHYDNDAIAWAWNFDLMFYSVDPALVNEKLLEAKTLLRQHGFIVGGKGFDVASDEITHTGRGITVLYRENNPRRD